MNETMNSSVMNCVDETSDDSHTCNGGFDRIHLSSLWKDGIPIIPSQHSLTPISFNNTSYQVVEGDIMTDDIKVTTTTTTSGSISSLPVMMPPHSPCTPQRPRRCITTPIPNTTPNAPWDERNHWSNNQQQYRRFRSVNHSVCSSSNTSENSSSTQYLQPTSSSLLRPAPMIERNISHSSSSSSSSSLSLSDYSGSEIPLSDHEPSQVMESPNAMFFSPRRRLNSSIIQNNNNNSNRTVTLDQNISLLSTLPVAVVSIPTTAMDIVESTNSNHDDRIHTSSSSCLSMEDGSHHDNTNIPNRCRWCFFPFSSQRNHPYQRRNLLLLFLIATYTTFGLASPNIQQTASIWLNNNHSQHGNIILIDDAVTTTTTTTTMINDVPFVTDQDAKRIPTHTDESSSVTVSEITTSSQLRGSTTMGDGSITTRKDAAMIQNHLSFARGGSSSTTVHANQFPNQPVFIYRRREMNDFYHQPALLQEDTTVTTCWYLNCFVLLMIAMYYAVQREHRKAIVSCATIKCRSGSSGTVHNTHLL